MTWKIEHSKFLPGKPGPWLFAGLLVLLSFCRTEPGPIPEATIAEARLRAVEVYRPGDPNPIGSGLLLNRHGLVLTCNHILRVSTDEKKNKAQEIVISRGSSDGPATLLLGEPNVDLAIVHWRPAGEVLAEFANLDDLLEADHRWVPRGEIRPGEPALLVGSPYGLGNSVLIGHVAHTNRLNTDLEFADIPLIQTTGLSYPGSSGAAVYVRDGRVAGINRATFGFAPGTGIGLTIPAGYVRAFLISFAESGQSERGE